MILEVCEQTGFTPGLMQSSSWRTRNEPVGGSTEIGLRRSRLDWIPGRRENTAWLDPRSYDCERMRVTYRVMANQMRQDYLAGPTAIQRGSEQRRRRQGETRVRRRIVMEGRSRFSRPAIMQSLGDARGGVSPRGFGPTRATQERECLQEGAEITTVVAAESISR